MEGVSILIPLYFGLQIWSAVVWSGGWRIAALAPIAAFAAVLGQALYAKEQGSNLWPLLMIFFPIFGLIYLGVVALVRRIAIGGAPKQ